jgi:hypothetical protein
MTRTNKINYKEATRAKVTGRFKELVVVFLLAIGGILLSVGLNAQSLKPKLKRAHKNECRILAKKRTGKLRSSRNHFLMFSDNRMRSNTPANNLISQQLPHADNFQLHIIREMVATHLKEQTNGNPIELAPLELTLDNNKLTASDNNPFLIAVEFGLQGKTIVIANATAELTKEIKLMMIGMGVPDERISITANADLDKGLSQEWNRRVEFMAI